MIYILHQETGGGKYMVKAFETEAEASPWKPYQRLPTLTDAQQLATHFNDRHRGTEKQKENCQPCRTLKK